MSTDSITQMEQNWNNLYALSPNQGIGNETLDIKRTDNSLFWNFEITGQHKGHVNYSACQDNSGDHKFCYAHVTLEKNGSNFPDKINYWFQVDTSRPTPVITNGKLPTVNRKLRYTHKTISQFPACAKNSMDRLLINIYS